MAGASITFKEIAYRMCIEDWRENASRIPLGTLHSNNPPFSVVIGGEHPHLQTSGKFLPTAFERRSRKMTTSPNLKPDSVSTESAKPVTGAPQHDAPKTPVSEPHAEPNPAQKS